MRFMAPPPFLGYKKGLTEIEEDRFAGTSRGAASSLPPACLFGFTFVPLVVFVAWTLVLGAVFTASQAE
jgi:hypothetical protein